MVQTGGGFVMPVVLSGGRVVGTWRQKSTKDSIMVEAAGLDGPLPVDVSDDVIDLGRFLRRQTLLRAPTE